MTQENHSRIPIIPNNKYVFITMYPTEITNFLYIVLQLTVTK